MKFVRIEAEYGECYQNSFMFLLANAQFAEARRLRYVQGVVTSSVDGSRIGHCWVEFTDPDTGEEFVMEPVPHGVIPIAEYYARGQVACVHKYGFEQMLGIWRSGQELGPWTDDVRDGLHVGEVPAPEGDRKLVQKARALGLPAIDLEED